MIKTFTLVATLIMSSAAIAQVENPEQTSANTLLYAMVHTNTLCPNLSVNRDVQATIVENALSVENDVPYERLVAIRELAEYSVDFRARRQDCNALGKTLEVYSGRDIYNVE